MRSIIARPVSATPAFLTGVALIAGVITGSLALAWVTIRFSASMLIAGLLGTAFCLLFLARPDVGLLLTLLVRSSTDLIFNYANLGYVNLGEGLRATLINPNTSLILILILGGGLYIMTHNVRLLSLPGGALLALLLITGLVGILRSSDVLFSFREWLPVVSLFLVYALTAHFFRTPQQIQRVVDAIAASFILPAIYGFSQLIGHKGFALGGYNRIFGSFYHPNPFAFYLAMIITLFTCQSFVTSGGRRRLSVAIVIAAGVLLVGTFTRIAWTGTILALLVIAAFRSWKLLVLVPVTALLVAVAFPATVSRVGNPIEDPTATGLEDRFEIWGATYRYWMEETRSSDGMVVTLMNRLGGLGPGTVTALTTKREGFSLAAHNDYIRVVSEYGVFGLTLYALLLLSMLFFGYRTIRATARTPLAAVPLGFFALTLAYIVMSVTDNVFAATQNQVYYWALAGMTVAISQMSSATASRRTGETPRTAARGTVRAVPKGAEA